MRVPKVVSNSALMAAVSKVAQNADLVNADPEKFEKKISLQSSFTQVDDEFIEGFGFDSGNKSMNLDLSRMTGIGRTPSFHSECNSVHFQVELGLQKQEDISIFPKRVFKPETKKEKENKGWSNVFTLGLMGMIYVSKKILAKKYLAAL